ncbi:MAG: FHA domain-containing protein [Gemmataceae bacterium]|nr:FHA domain-containing protein [Gemmataceae bacterium]
MDGTSSANLILLNERPPDARLPLTTPFTLIGTHADCDIVLDQEGVAGRHCVVGRDADGWLVRDLGAISGTFVNGRRVSRQLLRDGDILGIGSVRCRLEATAEASPRDAIRVQVAAVAAQQSALDEKESALDDRQTALAQLEEQRQEPADLTEDADALKDWERRLEQKEQDLVEKRLRFHGQYELGRRQLQDAFRRLREEQRRWKERRGQERAALKVREGDLERAQNQLAQAQSLIARQQRACQSQQQETQQELENLEARVRSLRGQLPKSETGICSAAETHHRTGLLARPDDPGEPSNITTDAHVKPTLRVAEELADQRAHLLEQWQRVTLLQATWDAERATAARDLEEAARELLDKGDGLAQREARQVESEESAKRRQLDLERVRQQLVALRAQLRLREKNWDGERRQLLEHVRRREELAEQQFHVLIELRRKWVQRRRQELATYRSDRAAVDAIAHEFRRLRALAAERAVALEEERRQFLERQLTFEQYRAAWLNKTEHSSAPRRIERLRRRWLIENTLALRAVKVERAALAKDLEFVDTRLQALSRRGEKVAVAEQELADRTSAWERQQALAALKHARLQEDLQSAQAQKNLSLVQTARLKEEIEHIARSLLEGPAAPVPAALDRAA